MRMIPLFVIALTAVASAAESAPQMATSGLCVSENDSTYAAELTFRQDVAPDEKTYLMNGDVFNAHKNDPEIGEVKVFKKLPFTTRWENYFDSFISSGQPQYWQQILRLPLSYRVIRTTASWGSAADVADFIVRGSSEIPTGQGDSILPTVTYYENGWGTYLDIPYDPKNPSDKFSGFEMKCGSKPVSPLTGHSAHYYD